MRFSPLATAAIAVATSIVCATDAFVARQNAYNNQARHLSESSLAIASTAASEEIAGPSVGDTRGATLLLEDVAISRGPTPLIRDVELRIEPGQRWGIVGPNGAGKSSLLGAITGTVRMDSGKALVGPKVRVGYLKQTAV